MQTRAFRGRHLPVVILGVLALLAGMWAGLARLGWELPPLQPLLPLSHGPLMVGGFLGTLIGLERAVALGSSWTYASPLLTGLGALALVVGVPGPAGPTLITLGSAGLVAVFARIIAMQPTHCTVIMGLGAGMWLVGNGGWLVGAPMPAVASWFAGFLVLVIAGERLELSRLVRIDRWGWFVLWAALGLYLAGLIVTAAAPQIGGRLEGGGMLALALWFLRYDVARFGVRQTGLTGFTARSLLCGYAWLGIGGSLWALFGGESAGARYDAMLHTVFLGFVFGMVFAHAPMILPTVSGRSVPFRARFYWHLILLNVSLAMRLGGDLGGGALLRRWGGLLNVLAVLMFLGNTVLTLPRTKISRLFPSSSNGCGVRPYIRP